MLPITLPVYVYDEATASAESMGIETNITDSDIQDARFYHIDHITSYPLEGGGSIGVIASGGSQMLSPMSMDELQELIEND